MLFFWESGIWVHVKQRMLWDHLQDLGTCQTDAMWLSPSKNPGHRVSKDLPQLAIFHTFFDNSLLTELSLSWVTPLGENSWKLAPGFPWTLLHVLFPFLCLVYFLTVINHSHDYDYMLSPVNPPGDSSNMGVVLRTSWHRSQWFP